MNPVSRGRLMACAAILLASLAAWRARADPYRLRGDALASAQAPAGLLILGTDLKTSHWIDVEAVIWAGGGELGGEADALVASLRLRDPGGLGEVKLGRLVVGTGAIRPVHVDGGFGLARLPWDGTLELFGGLPVVPRFGEREYDWLAGARLAQRLGPFGTIGVAYLHQRDLGRLADEEVGVDLLILPLDELDLGARAAYDLIQQGPSEVIVSGGLSLREWRFELRGAHRSPSRILPATSLFSVLGDTPSNQAALIVSWRAAPRLDLRARGGARFIGDDRGEDLSIEAVLRLDDAGRGAVGVELERIGIPGAAWSGARVFGRAPITDTIGVAAEGELAFVEELDRLQPWGLVAVTWRPIERFETAIAVEGYASPQYSRAIDALLRVSYAWGSP